jgi:hypothetical protein
MSLATVIRLEFAYPGVGILAGDSLQYLSTATAHGVIMVFYMIMPAIFGAFGNFLLPTQLGVHDVAFPRLNSAAFWFLPGGLIMLCQLVCTDRRYAAMNCFNIRELQGILKRKFFTDIINTHDHKLLLDQSMIGLRFKSNSNINLDNDMLSFYNYGLHKSGVNKFYTYESLMNNNLSNEVKVMDNYNFFFMEVFSIDNLTNFTFFFKKIVNFTTDLISLLNPFNSFLNFNFFSLNFLSNIIRINNFFLLNLDIPKNFNINFFDNTINPALTFNSGHFNSTSNDVKDTFTEVSSEQRYNRFNNLLINYDYKTGHYRGN